MASFKSYFRWILNSVCSLLLAQITLISYAKIPSRDRDDVIAMSIYSNRKLKKKLWCPGKPLFKNSYISSNTSYFKTPFWLLVDNNCIYIVPECQSLAPPRNTQTEATSFTISTISMDMSKNMVTVQIIKNCT